MTRLVSIRVDELTLAEDEEPLSKDTIERIEMSLKDIKEGRVYTTDEVKKRLKIA